MINPFFKFRAFFSTQIILSAILATQVSSTELMQTISYCSQPLIEVKTGYFFFSNSKMRNIYDRGGLDVQLGVSYPFWKPTSRWSLNAYGAVEYFERSGKSLNEHQKTSLWSIPINIGLEPAYAINANTQYYFAMGPRYFYIHQHNDSSFVSRNNSRNGIGFFVNTGFNYILMDHFVIDAFGEYSYAKTHFHSKNPLVYSRSIQIGGFTFGGGGGYRF